MVLSDELTLLLLSLALMTTGMLILSLKIFYWTSLWQLKEYRIDRMLDFLSTYSGRKSTSNIWTATELLFIVLFVVLLGIRQEMLFSEFLLLKILFLIFLGVEGVRYLHYRVTPVWTAKAMLIVFLTFLSTTAILILFSFKIPETLVLAILIFILPLLVTATVYCLHPITTIQKQRIIRRAKQKIAELHPIVIGVTGSFGKTSTKEFLHTILSEQFSVLSTLKNINVDIGVAQTILHQLTKDHQFFIVEMGAYRPGEIAAICHLVSPIIGIVVAVSEQHLALFGSREMIKSTKAELLQALPPSGLAVINRDNPGCMEIAGLARSKKKFFSVEDTAHVFATEVVVSPREIRFQLHIGTRSAPAKTRLHGQQVLPAILAAATVADHLGMSLEQIVRGIEKLQVVPGTMHLRQGKNYSLIIDDHYNSNPEGFLAAIDYLALFPDKHKVILTTGMYELGIESDLHHRNVGKRAGEVAQRLIITKKDFAQPLKSAARSGGLQEEDVLIEDRPQRLTRYLSSHLGPEDVILVEGRVHSSLLDAIVQD